MSRLERARELGLQRRRGLQNLPRSNAAKDNIEQESGLDNGERGVYLKISYPCKGQEPTDRQTVSKDLQPVSGGLQSPL